MPFVTSNTTTTTMEEDAATHIVAQVVPALLLLVGVGNFFTLISLKKHEDLDVGSRTYHMVLTVMDLVVLALSLSRFWLLAVGGIDIFVKPLFICKVLPMLASAVLMMPPWLLVAMALQAHEGLRKTVHMGKNVTRWKARSYSAFVFFICVLINAHILLFFGHPDEEEETGGGITVSPNTTTAQPSSSSPVPKECAPLSGGYASFYYKVWPWVSLTASVSLPAVILVVLCVLIIRRLIIRSAQSAHVPMPESFRQLVTSVLVLSVVSVLLSAALAGFAFADPRRYWTDYPATLTNDEAWRGSQFTLWCLFHLVFYVQFAGRWVVTCWCCQLWSILRSLCCHQTET